MRLGDQSNILNTYMMGNDYYETLSDIEQDRQHGIPQLGIGNRCQIQTAIIDKNCRIGRNVRIVNERELRDRADDGIAAICDGITVSVKDAVMPDGWKLM